MSKEKKVKQVKRLGAKDFQPVHMTIATESLLVDHNVNVRSRTKFDDEGGAEYSKVKSLMASIKTEGLLQHPIVRVLHSGAERESPMHNYQLFVGFRRVAAIQKLGWKEVTVKAYPADTPDEVMHTANFVENAQREDLSSYDRAARHDFMSHEYELSSYELSSRIGDSPSHIQNMLKVFRSLDPRIKEKWQANDKRCTTDYMRKELLMDDNGDMRSHSEQWEKWLKDGGNKDALGGNDDPSNDGDNKRGPNQASGNARKASGKQLYAALVKAQELEGDYAQGVEAALSFALNGSLGIVNVYNPEEEKAKKEAAKAKANATKAAEKAAEKAKDAKERATLAAKEAKAKAAAAKKVTRAQA